MCIRDSTKVDADYGGSPVYYAMLQMLTETIETIGSTDRMAIADHIRKNKFKTLVGELSLPGQTLDNVYTVGQDVYKRQMPRWPATNTRRPVRSKSFAGPASRPTPETSFALAMPLLLKAHCR